MAHLRQKKGQMRAVNLIIAILLSVPGMGQIQDGTYSATIPGAEVNYTVEFNKGRFIERAHAHLNVNVLSKGYYWAIGDTLFQYYEKQDIPPSCWIESKSRKLDILNNPSNDTHFQIEVLNPTGMLVPVNVLLRSDNNEVLKGLIPDNTGKLSVDLSGASQVSNILFSSFAEECQLDLIPLKGYNALIKVKFSGSDLRYNQYSGLRKFLVQSKSKTGFKLKTVEDAIIINLERL